MTLLIGGIILCGECEAVFGTLHDYEEHMEMIHMAQDEGERGDVAYSEGLRREA